MKQTSIQPGKNKASKVTIRPRPNSTNRRNTSRASRRKKGCSTCGGGI